MSPHIADAKLTPDIERGRAFQQLLREYGVICIDVFLEWELMVFVLHEGRRAYVPLSDFTCFPSVEEALDYATSKAI